MVINYNVASLLLYIHTTIVPSLFSLTSHRTFCFCCCPAPIVLPSRPRRLEQGSHIALLWVPPARYSHKEKGKVHTPYRQLPPLYRPSPTNLASRTTHLGCVLNLNPLDPRRDWKNQTPKRQRRRNQIVFSLIFSLSPSLSSLSYSAPRPARPLRPSRAACSSTPFHPTPRPNTTTYSWPRTHHWPVHKTKRLYSIARTHLHTSQLAPSLPPDVQRPCTSAVVASARFPKTSVLVGKKYALGGPGKYIYSKAGYLQHPAQVLPPLLSATSIRFTAHSSPARPSARRLRPAAFTFFRWCPSPWA